MTVCCQLNVDLWRIMVLVSHQFINNAFRLQKPSRALRWYLDLHEIQRSRQCDHCKEKYGSLVAFMYDVDDYIVDVDSKERRGEWAFLFTLEGVLRAFCRILSLFSTIVLMYFRNKQRLGKCAGTCRCGKGEEKVHMDEKLWGRIWFWRLKMYHWKSIFLMRHFEMSFLRLRDPHYPTGAWYYGYIKQLYNLMNIHIKAFRGVLSSTLQRWWKEEIRNN